ncbi:MAG: hydrogenase maturation protease [Endomicrobiia bacterium]
MTFLKFVKQKIEDEKLEKFFYSIVDKKVVCVGVGNTLKGDDGVGCYIVEKLKNTINNKNFLFINAGVVIENYLDKIIKFAPDIVIFFDALKTNVECDCFILEKDQLHNYTFSSHNISLATIIEFLEQNLNIKKASYFVVALKVLKTVFSESLSSSVKSLADKIVEVFLKVLKEAEKNYA